MGNCTDVVFLKQSGATFATRINPRTRVSVFMFEFPTLCGRLDWTDVVFCV